MADSQRSYSENSQIKELQTGKRSLDIKGKFKKMSNWITKNDFFVELDFFHTEVKFMVDGEETYTTIFGGLVGIAVLVLCFLLTYNISWPQDLNSYISITQMSQNIEQSGLSICKYHDAPIQFNFTAKNLDFFPDGVTVPDGLSFYAYYNTSEGTTKQIEMSQNCPDGISFCLNCSEIENKDIEIYGNYDHLSPEANLTIQAVWCDVSLPQCTLQDLYYLNVTYMNMLQKKGKMLQPYRYTNKLSTWIQGINSIVAYDIEIMRQNYESNDKFFGHLSNLMPWQAESFAMTNNVNYFLDDNTDDVVQYVPFTQQEGVTISFAFTFYSTGKYQYLKQEFEDVGLSIIFFLAILDPFIILGVILLIKWYNRNSKDLFIANKLFYVEDTANDQKYDFSSGPSVFFMCFFYRHPLMNLFEFLIKLCGYNLTDVLPEKCIEIISMINQGSRLLREEEFFKLLESLASIDNTQTKKVGLPSKLEEQDDEAEENYFPYDSIKREAFRRFCEDNEFYSGRRKNRFYELLTDMKYSRQLKSIAHKIFAGYVKNVTNAKNKGKFLETIHDQEIPVGMADQNKEKVDSVEEIEENNNTEMELKISRLKQSRSPIYD